MKKRNYVAAVGMIALLIQSGACAEDGAGRFARAGRWAQGKAAQVKAMTVDKLYDKAKGFVKDVKELRKCRKNNDCTPEQKRKVAEASKELAGVAAAVIAGGVVAGGTYRVRGLKTSKPIQPTEGKRLLKAARLKNVPFLKKVLLIGGEKEGRSDLKDLAEKFSNSELEEARNWIQYEISKDFKTIRKRINNLLKEKDKPTSSSKPFTGFVGMGKKSGSLYDLDE